MVEDNYHKRNLLSAYERTITFLSGVFGADSHYVRRLESERQKLERKSANDKEAYGRAQRVLNQTKIAAEAAKSRSDEASSDYHSANYALTSTREEIERRNQRGFFQAVGEWVDGLGTGRKSTQQLIESIPDLRKSEAHTRRGKRAADRINDSATRSHGKSLDRFRNIQSVVVRNERALDMQEQNVRVNEQIGAIARSKGVSPQSVFNNADQHLRKIMLNTYNLEDIDALIGWAKKQQSPETIVSPETLVALEFVNRVLIPRLDYFITQANVGSGLVRDVDAHRHPHITQEAIFPYSMDKLRQEVREDGSRTTPKDKTEIDLGFLLDESQGTHFERLNRAMALVDNRINASSAVFAKLSKGVRDAIAEIESSEEGIKALERQHEEGVRSNTVIERRQRELRVLGDARVAAASEGNSIRANATAWQTVTYWTNKMCRNIPLLEPITETIAEYAGHPNIGNMRAHAQSALAGAMVQQKAQNSLIALMDDEKVDVAVIRTQVKKLNKLVEELRSDITFKELEKDSTKQRALAEAFVNKHILSFGQRVSETIRDMCRPSTVDTFLAEFRSDNILHASLQKLMFGCADSNDLSIILAESNRITQPTNANRAVFKDFVENFLKPNIADFYAHGSRIDLIYQSNLTGLANPLYAGRSMIRGAYDARIGALFADSFGVHSDMGELTVRGALDVHNLFDYYMHRHGDDDMITDVKLRDGMVTGQWVKRRVSALPEDEIRMHSRLAKTANSYRQTGPDISDMFLRICGYEYFYPQAYNQSFDSNIMNNPEAPAAYVMANAVIHDFVARLSMKSLEHYKSEVGGKLDSLIAATFMDFFAELGSRHAADPHLGTKRAEIKSAAKETGTFGFVFDSYATQITRDATARFDLFLKLYERNLAKQLETYKEGDRRVLLNEIKAVHELTRGVLSPKSKMLDQPRLAHEARVKCHTFENTTWGSALTK